jgi:hypothetical protein
MDTNWHCFSDARAEHSYTAQENVSRTCFPADERRKTTGESVTLEMRKAKERCPSAGRGGMLAIA